MMQLPKSPIPSSQTEESLSSTTNPQILVIDDDPDGLEVTTMALDMIGITTLVARNGASGIRMAMTLRPDLILLDITLPDLNGFEVFQQLQRQPATSQIPVIAVTAMAMIEEQQLIEAAGFSDYLSKPFLLDELYEKVYRYLDS